MKRELTSAPLSEVIFEVKWDVKQLKLQTNKDSKIVAGIFLEKIKDKYPFYEGLELLNFPAPDDVISGVVQHRYRVADKKYPVVQFGPGVLSVNDLHDNTPYEWPDFKNRCIEAFACLESIQSLSSFVNSVSLRYINSIPYDSSKISFSQFLKEQMKLDIVLDASLLNETGTELTFNNFHSSFSFVSNTIPGNLNLMIGSGMKDNIPALVWDINFTSINSVIPNLSEAIGGWLDESHSKIENLFFSLIENVHDIK